MWKYAVRAVIVLLLSMKVNCGGKLHPYKKAFNEMLREPPIRLPNNRNEDDVQEMWIEQKLDHLERGDDTKNETWLMRYMENKRYFIAGGPIFIIVGGEWKISKAFLLSGHMYDMARQHKGMMYYTEHRFYGKSWPKRNASVENLKYLTIQQSLADLNHFIHHQKSSCDELKNSPVVLVGASYSGSMVAWFTNLYPEAATAIWASSAPIKGKLNFYEYMEIVGESISRQGGKQCYERIQNGVNGLVRILRSEQPELLLERLRVCKNFDAKNKYDVAAFFSGVANTFAAIVQSYSSNVALTCSELMSLDSNEVIAMIKYINSVYWPGDTDIVRADWCLDLSYEGMRRIFTDLNDPTGSRSWFYQTCNEFGWWPTATDSQQQPFSQLVPLEYFQQLCQDVFGAAFTLANMSLGISQTNNILSSANDGGDNQSIRFSYANVFFTHGQLDPWRAVGVQSASRGNVIVIPGYSHVADLGSIDVADSLALNMAKLKVAAFVRKRLKGTA